MSERQLATIRKIAEIKDIEGADRIQAYRVDGWWVVDQVGKYKVGEFVIFCEIDSWIPHDLAPFLSRGKEPKEFNEIKGNRLKTVKLKGQLSQGLLLPLIILETTGMEYETFIALQDGDNVSDILGITKWELSEKEFFKKFLANPEARSGGFPWFVPKSDQERIQNIKEKTLREWDRKEITWEMTEKLEGQSLTVYHINKDDIQDEGVCSRNINLKESDDNTLWKVVKKYDILNKIKNLKVNVAIQGELVGPGVCGNYYELEDHDFYCYNIWDIDNQVWVAPAERRWLCEQLDIKHVPVLSEAYPHIGMGLDSYLELAEGTSQLISKESEGVVFKANETNASFKAISNKYLINN